MRPVAAAVTALLLLAVSCGPRRRRTPDDTLVLVIETPMTTADSRYAISNYDGKLTRLVGAGLYAVDTDDLVPRLDLASKVEPVRVALPVVLPVPVRVADRVVIARNIVLVPTDNVCFDITVRDDARFSDGAPVTADDVAYTFQSVLAKGSRSLHHKGFTERYRSVTVRSPRVVRFFLTQPLATLGSDLDFAIIARRTGLGAGPYRLRELTSTHALLDANRFYHGTRPKVPHVEIKFVRDAAARLLMLVGGTADLVQNAVRLDLVDEARKRPRVKLASGGSVLLTYLAFNTNDPVLRDVRVRQAIALALDRRSLIERKFGGRARLATGLLPETHWAYSGDVPRWEHDLARAKRLLDEAGLRDPDGDGPRPRVSLVYKTSADTFRVAVARQIAVQLAAVGLAVEVRPFEFATFFADVKKGAFQLASMQTAELNDPDYYFFYFHSRRIPDAKDPDGGNRWRYRSAELDRLAEAGRTELDPVKRKAIYAGAQRVVANDVPIVTLWHEDNVVLSHVDVEGYRITPNARLIGLVDAWKR